jgi:hypothetical protein
LPELQAIQNELGDRVSVVGVQVQGTAAQAAGVMSREGARYPSVPDPGIGGHFDFHTIPYTVMVRPDGELGVAIAGGGDRELFRQQALALLSR